jgi:hypothetical protein
VIKWFDAINPNSKNGQKLLDMPLRKFVNVKIIINGIGNYSSCMFFRKFEEETGLTFAAPIEYLYKDRELLQIFLASLHQFCFNRNKWVRDKIEVFGLPSGIRHNEYWEDLYLRRHAFDYFAPGSVPYEIHTPHHNLRKPKTWSRSDHLPLDRVVRAQARSFTTNSLTVGPAAFMTGQDKVILFFLFFV